MDNDSVSAHDDSAEARPTTPFETAGEARPDQPPETDVLVALNRDLVARYRAALLASDPAIEPELVVGDTADEVEASFAAAQRLVAGIRESVRREQAPSVPAGAPGRATAGPHTAYDKIRAGLARM